VEGEGEVLVDERELDGPGVGEAGEPVPREGHSGPFGGFRWREGRKPVATRQVDGDAEQALSYGWRLANRNHAHRH
jgi:hypothetical protein